MNIKKRIAAVSLLFFVMSSFCVASDFHVEVEGEQFVEVGECCSSEDDVLKVRDDDLPIVGDVQGDVSLAIVYVDGADEFEGYASEIAENRHLLERLRLLRTVVSLE
ncbi:hypothetical protein JKY72_02675 [Candidatus Gracilibacteria bacterium]|nr:hypothetical protein [Candidatus Gracilibacteria bacterium]